MIKAMATMKRYLVSIVVFCICAFVVAQPQRIRVVNPAIIIWGDMNGDGRLTDADVTALANLVVGKGNINLLGDMNHDAHFTIADVTLLVNAIQDEAIIDPYADAEVDLGLSVKWAAYNVGAASPDETGNYYAWGETVAKNDYSSANYHYYENERFLYIGDDISGTEYDAVRVNWGGGWRMPTYEEIEELLTECTWTKTSLNNVAGYRVMGKNGNSIFLPLAGLYLASSTPSYVGERGYYWSSTLSEEYTSAAYNLNTMGYVGRWSTNRVYGLPVRGVKE